MHYTCMYMPLCSKCWKLQHRLITRALCVYIPYTQYSSPNYLQLHYYTCGHLILPTPPIPSPLPYLLPSISPSPLPPSPSSTGNPWNKFGLADWDGDVIHVLLCSHIHTHSAIHNVQGAASALLTIQWKSTKVQTLGANSWAWTR